MTNPEVQFVLDTIQSWVSGTLADIPLERIDRDNSDRLDAAPPHAHSEAIEAMNIVSAAFTDETTSPIGTEYNHDIERVVNVRLEGAHVSEHGAIDPHIGTADETSVSWPTTGWDSLRRDVRTAILQQRTFPNVKRRYVTYKDLFIENAADTSHLYSDYYQFTFDVVFRGFESVPRTGYGSNYGADYGSDGGTIYAAEYGADYGSEYGGT